MASWVYLFSKFTPEALLFEALAICILACSYASFFILRKRRLGAAGPEIPSSLVKAYLSELIGDAEQVRSHLFGLISSHSPGTRSDSMMRVQGGDPDLQVKISLLEAKMSEQAAATQKITSDKSRLEKELKDAKNGAPSAGGAGASTASDGELGKLKEKIASLEARLAEYSVIEDDLANLKRLQQENAQLKAQLGGAAPLAAATPAPDEAAPAAIPSPAADPEHEPASVPARASEPAIEGVEAAAAALEEAGAAPAAEPASAQAAHATPAVDPSSVDAAALLASFNSTTDSAESSTPDAAFEKVVDQVEQKIASNPPVAAASPTETSNPPTAALPKATVEKSDEDLIAEFEKMLNS